MKCIFCYSGIRFWLLHQLNKKSKNTRHEVALIFALLNTDIAAEECDATKVQSMLFSPAQKNY